MRGNCRTLCIRIVYINILILTLDTDRLKNIVSEEKKMKRVLLYVVCVCVGGGVVVFEDWIRNQNLNLHNRRWSDTLQNWKKEVKDAQSVGNCWLWELESEAEKTKAENCYNKLAELIIFKVCVTLTKTKLKF